LVATDSHIERRSENRASAIGETVHHRDCGLFRSADLISAFHIDISFRVEFSLVQLNVVFALFVNVAARREGLVARAGNHDTTDIVIPVRLANCIMQFHIEVLVHRVENFRAVQCDDRDAVLVIDQNVIVIGHVYSPS